MKQVFKFEVALSQHKDGSPATMVAQTSKDYLNHNRRFHARVVPLLKSLNGGLRGGGSFENCSPAYTHLYGLNSYSGTKTKIPWTAETPPGEIYSSHDQTANGIAIRPCTLDMEMFLNVFGHNFSIEQVDDPVRVVSVIRRVRYHDDGSSLFVQLGKKLHHLFTVG